MLDICLQEDFLPFSSPDFCASDLSIISKEADNFPNIIDLRRSFSSHFRLLFTPACVKADTVKVEESKRRHCMKGLKT